MITDVFFRRYQNVKIREQYFAEDRILCNQLWAMMSSGYFWDSREDEMNFKSIHNVLALELGVEYLSDRYFFSTYELNGSKNTHTFENSYAKICKNFLTKHPDDVTTGDKWMKERLSLAELAFARREQQIMAYNQSLLTSITNAEINDKRLLARKTGATVSQVEITRKHNCHINELFKNLVNEFNERLRLAHYRLNYHNGLIQLADDAFIHGKIANPFWTLVGKPPWENVDLQMKEAIDGRDTGDRMAAFHAACALESCIKIISNTKNWTTGEERGAASFIHNLTNKSNGRFLDVWECELLIKLFSDVRNPFAHGSGQSSAPNFSAAQTNWAIDTSMSWIKSLIMRM